MAKTNPDIAVKLAATFVGSNINRLDKVRLLKELLVAAAMCENMLRELAAAPSTNAASTWLKAGGACHAADKAVSDIEKLAS